MVFPRVRSAITMAMSPTKTAAASPKRRASPCQAPSRWRSIKRAHTVGDDRRVGEPSITSSWMRAKAWSNSSAQPPEIAPSPEGSPPAVTQPQWQYAGRMRLPPLATKSARSASGRSNAGLSSAHVSRSSTNRALRAASTLVATAKSCGGGGFTTTSRPQPRLRCRGWRRRVRPALGPRLYVCGRGL